MPSTGQVTDSFTSGDIFFSNWYEARHLPGDVDKAFFHPVIFVLPETEIACGGQPDLHQWHALANKAKTSLPNSNSYCLFRCRHSKVEMVLTEAY
jgi:hypothetical protein